MRRKEQPSKSHEGRSCRICSGALGFWATVREMHLGLRDRFDYLVCANCGCLQIERIPLDLERFYPAAYYTQNTEEVAPSIVRRVSRFRRIWTEARLAIGPAWRGIAGRRFGRFAWFTRTATRRRDAILDVGCGSGRLLWRLHHEGFENLIGIDPALGCAERTEQSPRFRRVSLDAYTSADEISDRTPDGHQLVMSHHSFEHVESPTRAFDEFARLVRPGGWLLLRTPLADSWACHEYGADWVQLDAPRHLYLHTRRSIEILAQKSGFRIVGVVDDSGPFQVWGSELYRRDVSLSAARNERRFFFGREAPLAARIQAFIARSRSQGDQACFYLQRMAST